MSTIAKKNPIEKCGREESQLIVRKQLGRKVVVWSMCDDMR